MFHSDDGSADLLLWFFSVTQIKGHLEHTVLIAEGEEDESLQNMLGF